MGSDSNPSAPESAVGTALGAAPIIGILTVVNIILVTSIGRRAILVSPDILQRIHQRPRHGRPHGRSGGRIPILAKQPRLLRSSRLDGPLHLVHEAPGSLGRRRYRLAVAIGPRDKRRIERSGIGTSGTPWLDPTPSSTTVTAQRLGDAEQLLGAVARIDASGSGSVKILQPRGIVVGRVC